MLLSASAYSDAILSALRENLAALIVSLVTTLGITAILYLISGGKNETIRRAFRPAVRQTWRVFKESRDLVRELDAYFDKSYEGMVDAVDGTALSLEEALARGIVESIVSTHYESHEEVARMIGTARDAVKARSRLFDEYSSVVDRFLQEIPEELPPFRPLLLQLPRPAHRHAHRVVAFVTGVLVDALVGA